MLFELLFQIPIVFAIGNVGASAFDSLWSSKYFLVRIQFLPLQKRLYFRVFCESCLEMKSVPPYLLIENTFTSFSFSQLVTKYCGLEHKYLLSKHLFWPYMDIQKNTNYARLWFLQVDWNSERFGHARHFLKVPLAGISGKQLFVRFDTLIVIGLYMYKDLEILKASGSTNPANFGTHGN